MEFAILGPLEVSVDGRPVAIPAGRQRAILALLLLNRNRVVTPDRLLDAIWGEALPATGAKAIAYHVSCLRDALAPDRRQGRGSLSGLDTEAAGYVLRVDADAVDAVRFERLARQAHAQLADDPAAARAAADEALGLWRGEPLIDVAFADFAQGEIRRLDELRLGLLEDRLEADLLLGRHREAIGEAEALLRDHPLRDRVRGLLMLALHRSGRQAEALRISAEGRRLVAEELGIDPSPELVRIESWILTQDPRLDAPVLETAGPAPRNPFKGLRSFGEADHADFFGREGLVRHLLGRIEAVSRRHRLLVLVGPSGSGKSSVVRAGLVPALRAGAIDGSGRWRIATMAPGTSPFRELAGALRADGVSVADETIAAAEATGTLGPLVEAALAGGATHFLLVVDQLEELYTNVDDATRDRFIAALGDALDNPDRRMLAIATLRADLFDRPLRSPTFGERVRQGLEAVTPLRRDELERAIVRPAAAVGIAVEPGLAADIIADVESQPATLPLLQYALTELFDRREGRTLTRAGYAAIHGATGALARAAEEAWSTFDAAARDLARQLLLRLVVLGDDAEVSPRRAPRSELQSVAERDRAESVLAELERRRLVTFDRDPVSGEATVEIAHEALLTNWPRLATWVDELRQALWMRRRVDDAAGEWEASGRSPGFLATGARLDQFAAWLADARLRPTVAERAYIDASCGERTRLVRRGRRLRFTVAAVLLAAAVAATSLTATLVGERQAAAELQDITTARGLAAGVVASLGKDPELSVLLALQAANATVARGYVVEEAYDALHWALG
ncbi:MAG TPA: BTAD domain-containing putative transcriptional regulator, partial [Candidatus Limnocylindrales bacterium]|nr:BTAD domain-containing putative transcriptional regulator [Candidatus Limnocylindrales bacterium]